MGTCWKAGNSCFAMIKLDKVVNYNVGRACSSRGNGLKNLECWSLLMASCCCQHSPVKTKDRLRMVSQCTSRKRRKHAERKKPDTGGVILHDFFYMK